MNTWQIKALQWGFLLVLVLTTPLLLRELRKNGIAQLQQFGNQPAQAQTQPKIPRLELENRFRRCRGLPNNAAIGLTDQQLNDEVFNCEQRK